MSVNLMSPAGTSAGGWPSLFLRAGATIFAGALLVGPAESTSASVRESARTHRPVAQSNAGMLVAQRERRRTVDGVAELRRTGGFTWEQLARLFNVSRRAVHFWASGQTMTRQHEEHLDGVLAAIRRIDRGSAEDTRRVMMARDLNGATAFSLLAERRYEEAVRFAGVGHEPATRRALVVPERESDWRPEHLEGALSDEIPAAPQPTASTRARVRRAGS